MKSFRGTGVALVTPFDDSNNLHISGLERVVQHVIGGGVEFLVPLGTTSEGATLTESEAMLCVETVIKINDGRLPIMLGCGGNNTREVTQRINELTKEFAGQIDGFLSVTPYYNRPNAAGLYAHYRAVAESTHLPIMLYNVPTRTGCNMLPETILRLASDCKNVIGVKEASGSMDQIMELIQARPQGFLVLSGDDMLALPSIACGMDGLISVSANSCPRPMSSIVRHALSGSLYEAQRLHYKLMRLIQLNFREGNPAGVKAELAALGVCGYNVRLPLAPASRDLRAAIQRAIELLRADGVEPN